MPTVVAPTLAAHSACSQALLCFLASPGLTWQQHLNRAPCQDEGDAIPWTPFSCASQGFLIKTVPGLQRSDRHGSCKALKGGGAGTWYASRCSKLPTAGQGTFSQLATLPERRSHTGIVPAHPGYVLRLLAT